MNDIATISETGMTLETTSESLKFLQSNWIFLFPAALLIYSIYIWYKRDDSFMTNIKRIYYSFTLLLYLLFLRIEDVTEWCSTGMFGISSVVWSYFLSMFAAIVIAVIIDNFIISGYAFKEFGILGAKFIKEDIKNETAENLSDQKKYIFALEGNIETLYEIPRIIDQSFKDNNISNLIKKNELNFLKYFKIILEKYYKLKNEVVKIDVIFFKPDEIESIVKRYETDYSNKIRNKDKEYIRTCISSESGIGYLEFGENKVFILNRRVNYLSKENQLLINIKSFDEINVLDVYPILNFLYIFIMHIKD